MGESHWRTGAPAGLVYSGLAISPPDRLALSRSGLSESGRIRMKLVPVYRFERCYDIETDRSEISPNYATREFVEGQSGKVLEETITMVPESDIDGVGVLRHSTKVIHCPCCGAGMFRPGLKPDPTFQADRFGSFIVCWKCKSRVNFVRDPAGPDVTYKLSEQQSC